MVGVKNPWDFCPSFIWKFCLNAVEWAHGMSSTECFFISGEELHMRFSEAAMSSLNVFAQVLLLWAVVDEEVCSNVPMRVSEK